MTPRLQALPRGLAQLPAFVAAAAVSVTAGALLPWAAAEPAGRASLVAALVALSCVLCTRAALMTLALLWGPAHTVLADFSFGTAGSQELTLSRTIGLATAVGFSLAALLPASLEQRKPYPRALRLLALFGAVFALATLLAPDRAEGAADLVRVVSGIAVALVAYRAIDTPARALHVSRLVVLGGVAVSLFTILQAGLLGVSPGLAHELFGEDFYRRSYDATVTAYASRVDGPLGSANATSHFLLVAAMFALLRYSLLRDARGRAAREIVALTVLGAGIVATLTRASLAALLVLAAVWLAQRPLRSIAAVSLRLRALLVTALLVIAAVPVLSSQSLETRIWDANPLSAGEDFAQGRGAIWSRELHVLAASSPEQALLGHGAHSSYVLATPAEASAQSPHNLFLWLAVETGLVGLAVYCSFLVRTVAGLRALARGQAGELGRKAGVLGLAAVAAYLVLDLFILTVTSPGGRWYFMLLLGVLLRTGSYRSGSHAPSQPA